jgi:methionyl-tRNA formyltransferase
MRIIFFGTPDFAVPSLRGLLAGADEVVGVVCQPDRPAGRGQRLTAPPVKETAIAAGVPVLQPEKIRTAEFLDQLRGWAPDLIVVAAYGRILPNSILELPPHGCINVHASLLPRYRGAAPMQWAIANGDERTGVTIMQVAEKMDAGDMLLQRATPISGDDTLSSLHDRLADIGAAALIEAIDQIRSGTARPVAQDETQVVYAPMIKKEDGLIDWSRPATEIERRVRAFDPWPSAHTRLHGKLLKISRATVERSDSSAAPGTVLGVGDAIRVACGRDRLAISELQLEGRKRLTAGEFTRGGHVVAGVVLV